MQVKEFFTGLFKWTVFISIVLALFWFVGRVPPQQVPFVIKNKIVAFVHNVANGVSDFVDSSKKFRQVGQIRFDEAKDVYQKKAPKDPFPK